MTSLVGTTFAGYEMVAELGRGGMGAVYKARQPLLKRFVALKVMAPHLCGDPAFILRFLREASTAAQISHPNMVLVHSAGEQNGVFYIVMEFVDGRSLQQHIASHGRLEPAEAVAIAVYVAQALQYAWNKAQLVHRDIKPANIFLSNAGEVKVGDLGLAKSLVSNAADVTASGIVMGSPHWMAPEQARAVKDIDFRADIYSLGCTLYQMLAGRTPYEAEETLSLMFKHVSEPLPDLRAVVPDCPEPLAVLVTKMMAKNRDERHASYEELLGELMAIHDAFQSPAGVKPATAAPLSRGTASTPTTAALANRSRWFFGAGACAVLIAGALYWAPWKPHDGTERPGAPPRPPGPDSAGSSAQPAPGRERWAHSLQQTRQVSAEQWPLWKRDLLAKIRGNILRWNTGAAAVDRAMPMIEQVLEEAHRMSDEQFARQKEALLDRWGLALQAVVNPPHPPGP